MFGKHGGARVTTKHGPSAALVLQPSAFSGAVPPAL